MATIPTTQTFTSKDGRRFATYQPAASGFEDHRGPVYRLVRTVRTRRGFGTIIHTLTTFTATKLKAHKSAALWVRVQTKDR